MRSPWVKVYTPAFLSTIRAKNTLNIVRNHTTSRGKTRDTGRRVDDLFGLSGLFRLSGWFRWSGFFRSFETEKPNEPEGQTGRARILKGRGIRRLVRYSGPACGTMLIIC